MKNWLLLSMTLLLFAASFSQTGQPPYKFNKNIPAFEIETVKNGVFKSSKLKKNVPLVIMFFSPGCDHCITQFESMKKRMNELKKFQIVMATYQPIEELADFDKKYQISNYPNITTGRDSKYFFPPFFEISNFPYLAFYDKHGKLIDTYEGNLSVDNMLKKFK
jgi:cytochrome oxidase Cu insertion factor (SCO1/SenC/PrrC family)